MIDEPKRRLWRRRLLRRQRDAAELGRQADQQIEKLLLRRFERLLSVKKFVFLWLILFVLLILTTVLQTGALSTYYQSFQPTAGGVFAEGVIGKFSNANPIYATGAIDRAVSRLVFSSLFKYDNHNQLVGDLAESWAQGPAQTHYAVKLKTNVSWQDGQKFNADDVVFTYQTIKNIEAQSPLYHSWKDINVAKIDDYNLAFDLPSSLSSFPHILTDGILPQHLLKDVPAPELRSAGFNIEPVGTGPFSWKFLQVTGTPDKDLEQRISLAAYKNYFNGIPRLDGLQLTAFVDEKQALSAFNKKQINALAGVEAVPAKIAKDKSVNIYNTPLTIAIMAFFKTSHPILKDVGVRQALVNGVDRAPLVDLMGYPVKLVDSPLLKGQLGRDGTVLQLPHDPGRANQLLENAGWKKGPDGYRYKDGQPLQFKMRSQDSRHYTLVTQYLQAKWREIGVKVDVQYHDSHELQAAIIASHDYDILVYGISLGVDPDVYAYWHSSQANINSLNHLNLSEYKSLVVDQALDGGRSRTDPGLRAVKYKPFLAAWANDAPALGLYQPNFLYISRGPISNYERKSLNTPSDRYFNVDQWMIRQERQNL